LAPFTFAADVRDLSGEQRREIARVASDAGLEVVGLHWLLVSPPGLHVNAPDAALRRKTVDYLRALVDFCGDVGARVMTFGSPKQRWIEAGVAPEQAWAWAREGYEACLPTLEARDVLLCMEALPPPEANFMQTAADAMAMVAAIDHPRVRMMLDVKSMSAEPRPVAATIRQYGGKRNGAPLLEHFHANDANRRAPGFGKTDFRPIAAALREIDYAGYVSIEVFDYTPDAETIAREGLKHLRETFGL
jgi:sugar phosphate isomerase/epimerase